MNKKIGLLVIFFGLAVPTHKIFSEKNDHLYCIILAGGGGKRLWPLSREALPKQLLPVGGEKTLLDQSIDRVQNLVKPSNIWISTTTQHAPRIQQAVGHRVGRVLSEPSSRNTGPAILLCCMELFAHDPQAIVAFLPADPYIPAESSFAVFLQQALEYVTAYKRIALLGLKPKYPATGYGYIEFDPQEITQLHNVYTVKKFREKPSLEVAQEYVVAGNMLWNAGMFCGQVDLFLQEFKMHASEMYEGVVAYMNGKGSYQYVISDSIDYALMEKSNHISVLPVDFPWCDVGNIEVFLSLKTTQKADLISIGAERNLVDVPGKLVALVGVHDLCVVDTGDALLIVSRQDAENVKHVVKKLEDMKAQKYL